MPDMSKRQVTIHRLFHPLPTAGAEVHHVKLSIDRGASPAWGDGRG